MPANQLDAALFLEADRMRSLAIVKDNLDNQRNAVQEERRLRVDNQPYGRADEAIEEIAFDNFAYKHSVIGSMDDLNAASVDDVAAFFKTYYAPNNAVLAIVGDVNTASTLERVRKHFESIPSQPPPPPVDISQPPQDKERRLDIEDPLARLPRIDIGYRIPSSLSPDDDAIEVLGRDPGGRPQLPLLRARRARKAARRLGAGVRADQPRPPAVRHRSHARARRVARPARAGHLLGDRRRQGRADCRCGDGEGAEHGAAAVHRKPRLVAGAGAEPGGVRAAVRRSRPDQHAMGSAREAQRGGRAARREAVSDAGEPDRRHHASEAGTPAGNGGAR